MTPDPATADDRRPHEFMPAPKIANYVSERGARAYFEDHRDKAHRRYSDRRERKILREYLGRVGRVDRLLDCPSGFGRLLDLCAEFAERVVEADFSPSMLALNEQLHGDAATYLQCSALDIPEADRAVDVSVSVRLSHHLESREDRLRHIDELCRVSGRAVVLTFFSSRSLKDRLRRLRRLWNGKKPKNTLAPADVRERFAARGFVVEAMRPLSRVGSGHVYVLARRAGQTDQGR